MKKGRWFLFIFLVILLASGSLLILSNIVFAKEDIELKNRDRVKIWQSAKQGISDEIIKITTSSDFKIEKQAVLVIIKQVVGKEVSDYLLVELPVKIAKKIIKATIKLAYFILTEDLSFVIKEIEKLTVEEAKEYAIDWLLRNEIKTSNGNLELSYPTYRGNWQKTSFPYIIVFHPLLFERAEVAIEIYSSEYIEAPSISRKYGWEGGIEQLEPFIVRINGEVEYVNEVYRWVKRPQIEVVFDEPVPELEFEELSLLDKVNSYFGKIETVLANFWDELKVIFSQINPFQAAMTPTPELVEVGQVGQTGEEEGLEELSSLEKKAAEIEEELSSFEIEEAQEVLDDIAERIDVLTAKIEEMVRREASEQNKGAKLAQEELSSLGKGQQENGELSSFEEEGGVESEPEPGPEPEPEPEPEPTRRFGGGGGTAPPPRRRPIQKF